MIKLNLDKNKNYLLACSYGPDSMALFYLLVKNKINFSCAIVNYHLREESDSEVLGLQKYAAKYNVQVHVLDVKEKLTKNIEAKAREIRYKYFKELCTQYGYEAVLIAQHQDDLIETYLMQKERQNDPIYYGISEETSIYGAHVLRPLLSFRKHELQEICDINKIPYSIDKTNFDVSILRNQIRHNIVFKLIKRERDEILKEIKEENDKLQTMFSDFDIKKLCDVDYILSLDFRTQCYALNYIVKSIDNSLSLSKRNVGQVIKILKSNKPNGQFAIFKGLFLFKEYEHFEFGLSKYEPAEYEYMLMCPGILDTPYFYLNFKIDPSNCNVSFDDYPLLIRNIKKSDMITINGYKAKAQRLLIDWKVPFRKRTIWPVILNKHEECVYIPRYRKDFKPTEDSNFYVK